MNKNSLNSTRYRVRYFKFNYATDNQLATISSHTKDTTKVRLPHSTYRDMWYVRETWNFIVQYLFYHFLHFNLCFCLLICLARQRLQRIRRKEIVWFAKFLCDFHSLDFFANVMKTHTTVTKVAEISNRTLGAEWKRCRNSNKTWNERVRISYSK